MIFLKSLLKDAKSDFQSGIVVFFVALPLCLAIAQVSVGEPGYLFAGIIAGIVGGIVVGFFSGSQLGVSGPAAGLVVIVSDGIRQLGKMPDGSIDIAYGFHGLLLATVIAGCIQIVAGFLKAGIIGNYFPSSVIKGMLAAIGITIILKELPHALGYDKDFMGDEAFQQIDGHNTFTEIYYAIKYNSPIAIIISVLSIGLLLFLDSKKIKSLKLFKYIPAALIVVFIGIIINMFLPSISSFKALEGEHLVQLPVSKSISGFFNFFSTPDFGLLNNPKVYTLALTLAMVASLETLLSLEATDKLDPLKRTSSGNRELKAQGIGNMVSGLIGGLPVTQVIVRSSANINSGAKSKMSAIVHGSLLLVCAIFIPSIINYIPLAVLAVILILVGYKLTNISLIRSVYKLGWTQFIPFVITIFAILATDLLKGIGIGMLVAYAVILRENYRNTFKFLKQDHDPGDAIRMELSNMVTFINKGVLISAFDEIPNNSYLIIDGSNTLHFDYDVLELIHEFKTFKSQQRNIKVELIKIPDIQ